MAVPVPPRATPPEPIPPAASAGVPRLVRTARDFDFYEDDPGHGAPLLEALLAPPPRPSLLRLPPGATPVFEGAALLTLLTIAAAIGGAHLGAPAGWVQLFDNLHWSFADLGAAWLAWIGVHDARHRGLTAEFEARRWFALAFSSYALGQMLWNLQVFLGWHPFPAPSDLAYLMLAPFCAIGMMSTLRGRVTASQRLAAVLDTLSLSVATVALALVIYLPRRGAMSPLELGVMVAYPTMLLAASIIGLMLVALLRVGRSWSVWTLVGVLGTHGVLWMDWNALTLAGTLADGTVVNSLFSVCTLAGGLAVSSWRVESATSERADRFYEGALRMLPLVVVVGVTFAVTLQESIARLSHSARLLCQAAAVLVIVLAAIRQTLILRDRDQLIDAQHRLREREEQLSELNQHLEQRVSERTQEAELRNAELSTALRQLSMAQHELVRTGKLAGLGSLVNGVAIEMNAALDNARMVASTLPGQVEALARLRAAPAEAIDDRRRSQLAGHMSGLEASHRQLGQSLDQAHRLISGFRQLAIDQTSDQRRSFDLLATVREVIDLTRLSHRHDPIEIIVTGETDLRLDSYPGPVGQVVRQLIDNAVVHGIADRRDGTIEVRVWPSGHDAARITVRDNGAGIAPGNIDKVFDPFFTTRIEQGGSGLGLTICRNTIHGVLGGRIEIISPPGAGTTVTVTLPRRAPR